MKGSLNSQFDFLYRKGALVREVAVQVCSPRLVNVAVVVNGLRVGADMLLRNLGKRQRTRLRARLAHTGVCEVSAANEHTRCSGFLGHWPC